LKSLYYDARSEKTSDSDYVFYDVRNKLIYVKFSLKPVSKRLHKYKYFSVVPILTCVFEKKTLFLHLCSVDLQNIFWFNNTLQVYYAQSV